MRWAAAPRLDRPVLITAFSGWNDAGDAASSALRFLSDVWGAEHVADIDPDEFYDFTQIRPTIADGAEGERRIDWPAPEVRAIGAAIAAAAGTSVEDAELLPEAMLVIGAEPTTRWRTFCREITDLASDIGATQVVHLGALLAEVPHSRPVPVSMSGGSEHDERSRRYQGPTGIVGVLHQACIDAGLSSVSLWASVPTYVSGASSPKAALALVCRVAGLMDVSVPTGLLEISAQAYDEEIDQLVEDDEETAAYVARLERDYDAEASVTSADGLTDEIERFLRDHRG